MTRRKPPPHVHLWYLAEMPPRDGTALLIGQVPWICECGAVEKDGRLGPGEALRFEVKMLEQG